MDRAWANDEAPLSLLSASGRDGPGPGPPAGALEGIAPRRERRAVCRRYLPGRGLPSSATCKRLNSGDTREWRSPLAHASHRLWRDTGCYLRLDAAADVPVDILPIGEGALQHRRLHSAEQAARDLGDETVTLGVVHHLAHQRAGLAEVVVVLPERIGATHHLAVGLPAFGNG